MGVSVCNDPNPTTIIRRTFHFQDCFEILIVVSFCITFWGGGGNSKKVNTHPKIPEIDLDFFRLLLTFNKIVQILS